MRLAGCLDLCLLDLLSGGVSLDSPQAQVVAYRDDNSLRCADAAFEVDRALFQYSRGAKELWKFCNMTDIEWTAGLLSERPSIDWWERGAPRR